jgi:hypothetical protein
MSAAGAGKDQKGSKGAGVSRSGGRTPANDAPRAKPKLGNPDDYYVKIVKYRGRGLGFFIMMASIWVMMTVVLFLNLYTKGPWLGTAVPLALIGMISLIYPPTEDWLYRPWQAIAQQVERHFYDN